MKVRLKIAVEIEQGPATKGRDERRWLGEMLIGLGWLTLRGEGVGTVIKDERGVPVGSFIVETEG